MDGRQGRVLLSRRRCVSIVRAGDKPVVSSQLGIGTWLAGVISRPCPVSDTVTHPEHHDRALRILKHHAVFAGVRAVYSAACGYGVTRMCATRWGCGGERLRQLWD